MADFDEIADPPMKNLFDSASGTGVMGTAVRMAAGAPGPDLLRRCLPLFQAATKHRLEREHDEANLFQYGSVPGAWEFRDQLGKFLTQHYQDPVNRADLILTCGATHGLHVVISTLLAPGAVIFVEEATYMIALELFKEFPQFPIVAVDIDDDGLVVEDLQEKAENLKAAGSWDVNTEKPFWAMMYCIPVFHNPTGTTLSSDRCEKLVQLARKLEMLVFCDDVYNLLAHRGDAIPRRVFAYDRSGATQFGGHVISNGTFSKILAPGTRVGWLEAPPRLVTRLRQSGLLRSSGAVNQYMSGIVTSLLELGLQRDHLRFLTNTLQGRMLAVCTALETHLPSSCKFKRPRGGYYIWVTLPSEIDTGKFAAWSEREYKSTALPGGMFAARPGDFTNCLRLSVAFHSQPTLEAATVRLCEALRHYLCNPGQT
ncbi:hypothetical protein B566_EDAN010852 [Ephemera danica]|nr:hypothetical protein B566_EDAN010852 [Ephemera danica]